MGISAGVAANWLAWVLFLALFALAVVAVDRLGFVGLFILGLVTWLVCLRAGLDNDNPGYGTMRSLLQRPASELSPEQREARYAERQTAMLPLRFFGRCGMVLTAIGVAGFAWQWCFAAPPA